MQFFRAIYFKKKYVVLGAAVLAAIGLGAHFLPPVAEYTSAVLTAQTKRELPIYCVQTEEKKVAVSFDAAWGADDTDAVSYTHLDVYKRQLQSKSCEIHKTGRSY